VGSSWGGCIDVIYSTGSAPPQLLWRRPEATGAGRLHYTEQERSLNYARREPRAADLGVRFAKRGGRGGGHFWSWTITRTFLPSFFLEFRVSGFRINFFDILCTFSQISIALVGLVVVVWSSGGGCYVACGRAQKLRHAQKPHRARFFTNNKGPQSCFSLALD
jgi:hypothetical protein